MGHVYAYPTGKPLTIPRDGEYGNRAPFRVNPHRGVDDAVPAGTSVYAAIGGEVVAVYVSPVLGKVIVIRGLDGFYWFYCHLSTFMVAHGDEVRTGKRIALSGATGNVTGAHLHVSVGTSPLAGVDTHDPMRHFKTIKPASTDAEPITLESENELQLLKSKKTNKYYAVGEFTRTGALSLAEARAISATYGRSVVVEHDHLVSILARATANRARLVSEIASASAALTAGRVSEIKNLEAESYARAVEDILKDEFAAIPDAVIDEIAD